MLCTVWLALSAEYSVLCIVRWVLSGVVCAVCCMRAVCCMLSAVYYATSAVCLDVVRLVLCAECCVFNDVLFTVC